MNTMEKQENKKNNSSLFIVSGKQPDSWTKRIKFGSIGLVLLLFLGYLGWEAAAAVLPPTITIIAPATSVVEEGKITMVGKTAPAAFISVNQQQVFVNQRGEWQTDVFLSEGINTIVIESWKKYSGKNKLEKQYVYQPK